MKHYQAGITINAAPEIVWRILTDASGYPGWDPGMVRVEGQIEPHAQVKFITKFNPDQAFAVKVTRFEPSHTMVFTGGMPLGLFKSERTHTLRPNADGGTEFHTREIFSGILLPLFGGNIPDLTENFQGFAAALKAEAEKQG